jgi:hypothetical protein
MAASDIEHARALLEMAKRDHRALSRMLDSQDFAEEIFGFHAQQVVEKALKAWIAAKALAYPKSHDLTALTKILERSGEPLHGISGLTGPYRLRSPVSLRVIRRIGRCAGPRACHRRDRATGGTRHAYRALSRLRAIDGTRSPSHRIAASSASGIASAAATVCRAMMPAMSGASPPRWRARM